MIRMAAFVWLRTAGSTAPGSTAPGSTAPGSTAPALAVVDEQIAGMHKMLPSLHRYRFALLDLINSARDYRVELYEIPAMHGNFVSLTVGIRLLWLPEIRRAALNGFQDGDWQWTDAEDPDDAVRRYREGEMQP